MSNTGFKFTTTGETMMFNYPTVPTFEEVMDRQKDFLKAFVDLKVEGFKSYNKALDTATYSYFTTYNKEAEKFVVGLGNYAKEAIDYNPGKVQSSKK
jgi:hypothetical protein